MIETCLKCVSLVWFVLLVAVANAQTSSLILSNLEDATTTNLIESQQSSDQPLIAECQLLLTVMKSTCEVTTIQGLTLQSEEKILNCCNIATQILENDCYEPCEDSQTIDLWLKPICQLNVTTDCQTAAQNESASSQNVEFRAARTEQNLAYEPSVSGGQSSTLVLDYTDSAEDFAMQLEQAVNAFESTLAEPDLIQDAQSLSTVVLGSGGNQQVPQILQRISNTQNLSISYELFRQVPEIVEQLNSDNSLTLLVPINDAWESFAVQQGRSMQEVKDDFELIKSMLNNTIGWGMSQYGVLERQQDALLLTLAGSKLSVSRSALSGSIVVRGCCDVENTAKVTDVDFVVDPTFAIHLVNRIVLSEAAFKIIQGASGVQVSPFIFPFSPSLNALSVGSSSPVSVPPAVTQNNNIDDSDNTAPMSLQELRDLVSNLPTSLEIPADFISLPSPSPLPPSQPSTDFISLPSPSPLPPSQPSISPNTQSSSVTTLNQITQQIEDSQSTGTLLLGLQPDQVLQKVEFVAVPVDEQILQQVNDSAAQSVLEQVGSGNVFDQAPVGVPAVAEKLSDVEDAVGEELPADILEIMNKVRSNQCDNVSDVLSNDPELNNFQVILQETDLMRVLDDLSEELQFTLFAPNNEGFEKLIAERGPSVEPTLSNATLMEQILSYHVIPYQVFLAGVTSGTSLQTTLEQGEEPLPVTIKSYGSSLTVIEGIGSNAVVTKSLDACNVIVHVVDTVLIPFI